MSSHKILEGFNLNYRNLTDMFATTINLDFSPLGCSYALLPITLSIDWIYSSWSRNFLTFYLMMFGVGICIIFNDKPILVLTWISLILIFVSSFIYYSGTTVIYKVEFSNENLAF